MKITISGSLGNIGKPLIQKLVAAGHDVTVISSQADRREAIESLGAQAAIGSVSDAAFLAKTLAGTDAVFAMTPPNLGGANVLTNTVNAGRAFATAIQDAEVRRVVMLSSIGADLPSGTGPIAGLYGVEKVYEQLDNVSVTFLRAGYFYTNFFNDMPMIKGAGIMGGNFSADTKIPMVHPVDIAAAAAEELQENRLGKGIRYVVGDERTPANLASVIGQAIGKADLPWVEFTDEQSLQGMTQAGLPQEIANLYTEMGSGLRSGIIQRDFQANNSPLTGVVKLEDFAKEFAEKF